VEQSHTESEFLALKKHASQQEYRSAFTKTTVRFNLHFNPTMVLEKTTVSSSLLAQAAPPTGLVNGPIVLRGLNSVEEDDADALQRQDCASQHKPGQGEAVVHSNLSFNFAVVVLQLNLVHILIKHGGNSKG